MRIRNEDRQKGGEERGGTTGGRVWTGALSSPVSWRPECLLLPHSQAPDAAVSVLCCSSPTSGEVNLSAGGVVSKAVHCEPLGDVNGIELQGTKVKVLKLL